MYLYLKTPVTNYCKRPLWRALTSAGLVWLVRVITRLTGKMCTKKYNINTGKRTEWNTFRSVIIRVRGPICNHEYDYRQTSDDTKST